MGVVLVPVADRPECVEALNAAFAVAERIGADVIGCHVRYHRDSQVKLGGAARSALAEWEQLMAERDPQELSDAAQALFARLAEQAGFPVGKRPRKDGSRVAIWQERVGSPSHVMPIVGPLSDLVVVSRPAGGGKLAWMFLIEALLNSVRPVLVLPKKKPASLASRVLVAWDQRPDISRAVMASMAVLEAADQVTIVAGGREDAPGPKASHVLRYLAHHRVEAEQIRTPGKDVSGELLQAYKDTGSDLLLMGAYSRNRLWEFCFGGVTDYMLRKASIPVLMYHS